MELNPEAVARGQQAAAEARDLAIVELEDLIGKLDARGRRDPRSMYSVDEWNGHYHSDFAKLEASRWGLANLLEARERAHAEGRP